MTLEVFCEKNDLYLMYTEMRKTTVTIGGRTLRGGIRKDIRKQAEWSVWLLPPVLERSMRVVYKGGTGSGTLLSVSGKTPKEARENLLKRIRGSILEYSNSFDRQCGDDLQISVPKSLR